MRLGVDPGRHEALELRAAAVDHAERRVARRRSAPPPSTTSRCEERLERQLRGDRHARLEERAQAALARRRRPSSARAYRERCGKPTTGAPVRPRCRRSLAGRRVEVDRKEYDMFKTILWATDGSETAPSALPYALGLAEPDHAKLVVAHVARDLRRPRRRLSRPRRRERAPREDRAAGRGPAEPAGSTRPSSSAPARADHAARTIAEIAEEVGADLIVVGTHGYGRVAGLLVGSVTQGLLHAGVCPVLAIPTGAQSKRPSSSSRPARRCNAAGKPQHGSVPAPMLRLFPRASLEQANRRLAMKALVYHGPGQRSWDEVPDPTIERRRTPSSASTRRRSAAPICTS